jgi:hypothetical protein
VTNVAQRPLFASVSDTVSDAAPAARANRSGPRTVRMWGREYPVILPTIRDPRLHVAAVLLTLQVLGQTVLDFRLSVAQILACLITGALIEFVVVFFKDHAIMWPASGLLTGNSTAFILRVQGTLHGQWWSTHGIEIFIGVVAISMASKYLIRWKGRHIFNPSNLGLVLCFVVLGPQRVEPLDLWWIPMGPWMALTYVILIGGGLLIGARLGLLGMEVAFMACFAALVALALAFVPDHCMVASWHLTPLCGRSLWQILVTSPEVLIFALFMLSDPRTVPEGRVSRIVFGAVVALLSVLLLGPTTLEFWTKTAILASLVVACTLRFALARFLAPLEAEGVRLASDFFHLGWRVPVGFAVAMLCVGCVPIAADLSTHGPQPAAAISDGSTPNIPLHVGSGPALADWVDVAAGDALPPPNDVQPVAGSATARVWVLPPLPTVAVPDNVSYFNPSMTPQIAAQWGRAVVLDLLIEAEARRTHDANLAATGAVRDGLKVFTDISNQDAAAGKFVATTYSFDHLSLNLFLPKFKTQASRLVGITVTGTVTLVTRDQSGRLLSQTTGPYSRSWSMDDKQPDGGQPIFNDFSDLALAH